MKKLIKEKKWVKDLIDYALIIIFVFLFRTFLFTPIRVTGSSMVPTLLDGDIMILNKIGYKLNGLDRFDIVVIDYEENGEKEEIIKRVIGLPGEIVYYEDNNLYVNGELIEETYTRYETDDFLLTMIGEYKIPEGKYLVMGDNRPISKDSRYFGLVDEKDIKGYTSIIMFPFSRIGRVN